MIFEFCIQFDHSKFGNSQNKTSPPNHQRVDLHGVPIDENGKYFPGQDYYQWYADQKKIPNVILEDYRKNCGPWSNNQFLWFCFCLLIAAGNRFSTPRIDLLFNKPYLRAHWKFHFLQWLIYLPVCVCTVWLGLALPIFLAFPMEEDRAAKVTARYEEKLAEASGREHRNLSKFI